MPGSSRTWTIKGVGDGTRDAVLDAALDAGQTVGQWIDQALARAAEEARHPRPPAASRTDVAEVVQQALAEGLRPVLERLEQLERKTARLVRAAEGADSTSRVTTAARGAHLRPRLTLPGGAGPERGGGNEPSGR
jgi:hypothetical protein